MSEPVVFAIIPAKGRSSRIPGKNLKMLAGKPMLAHILDTAKSANGISRIIVSTESEEVKKVAEERGAEVPFLRPPELAADDTTTQEVLLHAIHWLESNGEALPDYILLLYATSPLLKKERIEEAIQIAKRDNADSVISGYYDKGHYWVQSGEKWERLYPKKVVNSQYQAPLFVENGAIYLTRTDIVRDSYVADKASILVMEKDENIDVDYPRDFERAEARLSGASA